MATRRERLEAKLEKRQDWAQSRKAKAAAAFNRAHAATAGIPMGQPILIGHHSERAHRAALARSDSAMRAGCESADMAEHHESKAAGLAAQLETSVFSDDPDAVEALQAKIDEAEAERARWKAYNTSCRKGAGDLSLLDESQRREIVTIQQVCPYQLGKNGACPGYKLTNLGGNIRRMQQRIEEIKRRQQRTAAAESSGGGVLIEGGDYVRVTFAEKPDRSILNALKDAGFRWGGGSWSGRRDALPASVTELTESVDA